MRGSCSIHVCIFIIYRSPEQIQEAIMLEQKYLVQEPPKDPREHGVVVASDATPITKLNIPSQ